jgi:hypothetical protein
MFLTWSNSPQMARRELLRQQENRRKVQGACQEKELHAAADRYCVGCRSGNDPNSRYDQARATTGEFHGERD